jgi:uncharacterized protein YigA (DUF484 family)
MATLLSASEILSNINTLVSIIILLVGTNVFGFVMWWAERHKRKNENAKSRTETIEILVQKNESLSLKVMDLNDKIMEITSNMKQIVCEKERLEKEIEINKTALAKFEKENIELRKTLDTIINQKK